MVHFMLPEFQLNKKKKKNWAIWFVHYTKTDSRQDLIKGVLFLNLCLKDANIILDTHVELN